MRKRRKFNITKDTLEITQYKNCLTPMVNKVSGQRSQLVQSQFESVTIPIEAEMPLVQSSMIQEILTRSTCIQKLRGTIKILGKFSYQDITYYIYEYKGMAYIHCDGGYAENNGFATQMSTDLKLLDLETEYDISNDDENFLIKYPKIYNPVSQTVGFGANVTCIISTVLNNAQDSVPVSERFLRRFATLRTKGINIHLNKKKIISKYPNIFPKLGEFLDNPLLFKIVKDDNSVTSLAQDPLSPSGFEDDSINLEPLTFINRIEVYCNNTIDDPILNKYKDDMLKFRQDVFEFVNNLNIPLSDELTVVKNNFRHTKFRDYNIDLKEPLIKIFTKTVSLAETECKLSNLNGGKVTIASIYKDHIFTDEFGETIDLIYPANSLINRSISGVLYEVHLNSVGRYIQKMVNGYKCTANTKFGATKDDTVNQIITPERLYEGIKKLFEIIGKGDCFEYLNWSPEVLFEYLKTNIISWNVDPYDKDIDIPSMSEFTYVAQEYFNWRPEKVFNNGVEVTEEHVVGRMFIMRLMHDRYHTVAGCAIPRKDSRGHIVEKSTAKKDGRMVFGDKPTKLSILANHKLLNTMSNEAASIIFKEKDSLHGTHELTESVGFKLQSTKVIRNRQEVLEEEIDD
ncbi:MAG: hypothetical protein ACRCX2_39165 [Paraclostridium sp.]